MLNTTDSLYDRLLKTKYGSDFNILQGKLSYDSLKKLCEDNKSNVETRIQKTYNNCIIFTYRISKSPDLYPVSSSIDPNSFANVCKVIWNKILTNYSVLKYNNYEELFKNEFTKNVINYYIKTEIKERKRVK